MEQFLTYTFLGLVLGAVYAIAASGLVLTYTTSGIFNFAHGAQAMLGAFLYWQLTVPWGLPAVRGLRPGGRRLRPTRGDGAAPVPDEGPA